MTLTQLDALWNTYYPRIIGEIWRGGQESKFRSDGTFRRQLIESLAGFLLPQDMALGIQDGYNYDYYFDPDGLWLPLPKAPDSVDQALQLYLVQENAIEMPGFNPGLQKVSVDTTPNTPLPAPARQPGDTWQLWGRDLRETAQMMPRLVAMEWLAGNSIPNPLPLATIDQFNQISLADFYANGGQITFGQLDPSATYGFVYPGGLDFPTPQKPTNLSTVYTAWADGNATNPTTTYCPVTGR